MIRGGRAGTPVATSRLCSPSHPLSALRDMGHVMPAVPGVEGEVFLQWHVSQLRVVERPLPVLRLHCAQQTHPTIVKRVEQGVAIVAPLTGVYYSAPSPTTPPFVNIGEMVHAGQIIALIEAMKVFNEINAEISGKVIAFVAANGSVVQKGEVLLRIEPA